MESRLIPGEFQTFISTQIKQILCWSFENAYLYIKSFSIQHCYLDFMDNRLYFMRIHILTFDPEDSWTYVKEKNINMNIYMWCKETYTLLNNFLSHIFIYFTLGRTPVGVHFLLARVGYLQVYKWKLVEDNSIYHPCMLVSGSEV